MAGIGVVLNETNFVGDILLGSRTGSNDMEFGWDSDVATGSIPPIEMGGMEGTVKVTVSFALGVSLRNGIGNGISGAPTTTMVAWR